MTLKSPNLNDLPDFSLTGVGHGITFAPTYYPERVSVSKERRLQRTPGLCADQNVNDIGAKNREFHVNGFVLEGEKETLEDVIDSGRPFTLSSMPKSARVLMESTEIEGPVGIDTKHNEWIYEYTLDAVATGTEFEDDGIINDGSSPVNVSRSGSRLTRF